jgi:hypothetical protein
VSTSFPAAAVPSIRPPNSAVAGVNITMSSIDTRFLSCFQDRYASLGKVLAAAATAAVAAKVGSGCLDVVF